MFLILTFICVNLHAQKTVFKKIGKTTVYKDPSKNIYLYTTGMKIDADGSPHAYHPQSANGLDRLGNAGDLKGKWWGIVTDKKGRPVIQKENDPAPGFYVSTTSLADKGKNLEDPLRYVDAETIPYIILPGKFSTEAKLGDIAFVLNKNNGKKCFAIYAETGPVNKIGEGSMALAKQLEIPGTPRSGGVESGILYIVFKKSGSGKPLSIEEINKIGEERIKGIDIEKL
jgi:hypothetical protein